MLNDAYYCTYRLIIIPFMSVTALLRYDILCESLSNTICLGKNKAILIFKLNQ